MKKIIMIGLVILLLVPVGLTAGIFDFSVGVLAQNKLPYDVQEGEFDADMFTNFENYAFGADIRTRILFAEVGVAALYEEVDSTPAFSGLVTGGLSLDLLGLLRVGLGLGPRVTVMFPENSDAEFYFTDETLLAAENFGDAFMRSDLTWRATVDLKLGSMLVGLNYMVDSDGFNLEEADFDKLLPTANGFKAGRIGASVLFTLF
ncbi:MAG TPA: hypothetical protein VKZ39_00420 [Sphaerochaetaceae bacterium]|nr:hypothetical protein [Sphaerochaetaceae bacterium]